MPGRTLVLYDGECVFCRRSAGWILAHDARKRFNCVPFREAGIDQALRARCERALHIVTPSGRVLDGGKAVLFIAQGLGYRRSARILARRPLFWMVEYGYRLVANNRGRISRAFRL